MPYDPNDHFDEEQDARSEGSSGRRRKFLEFDCPDCNANNPYDDGFGDGDDVLCNYCGQEYRAKVNEDGRLRLKLT